MQVSCYLVLSLLCDKYRPADVESLSPSVSLSPSLSLSLSLSPPPLLSVNVLRLIAKLGKSIIIT